MGNKGHGRSTRKHGANKGKKTMKYRVDGKLRNLDIDQRLEVYADEKKLAIKTAFNDSLPGMGQFYCPTCDKYFINELTLSQHKKTKVHRRCLQELKTGGWTPEDAVRAAGVGAPDNGGKVYSKSVVPKPDEIVPELIEKRLKKEAKARELQSLTTETGFFA